jgi:anti-anti-sigma factor
VAGLQPFGANVDDSDGEVVVVLRGDIDLVAVPELFARIQEAERAAKGEVVVLMTDVTMIDSSGLGVLARLAAAGVRMELRGAQGVVRRALEISGLDKSPNLRLA